MLTPHEVNEASHAQAVAWASDPSIDRDSSRGLLLSRPDVRGVLAGNPGLEPDLLLDLARAHPREVLANPALTALAFTQALPVGRPGRVREGALRLVGYPDAPLPLVEQVCDLLRPGAPSDLPDALVPLMNPHTPAWYVQAWGALAQEGYDMSGLDPSVAAHRHVNHPLPRRDTYVMSDLNHLIVTHHELREHFVEVDDPASAFLFSALGWVDLGLAETLYTSRSRMRAAVHAGHPDVPVGQRKQALLDAPRLSFTPENLALPTQPPGHPERERAVTRAATAALHRFDIKLATLLAHGDLGALPRALQERLLQVPVPRFRAHLAGQPSLPTWMRQRLRQDGDTAVRMAA